MYAKMYVNFTTLSLFQSNLDIVVQILAACNLGADICKNVCGRKFKFFANYDKWLQQSRNFHYEAFKTHKTWFPALLPWTLPRLCIWTLSKGLTASCAPELHHLLLTRRGSPLKKKNLEQSLCTNINNEGRKEFYTGKNDKFYSILQLLKNSMENQRFHLRLEIFLTFC